MNVQKSDDCRSKAQFSLQLGVSYKYEMTVHSTEITPKKRNVSCFVLH